MIASIRRSFIINKRCFSSVENLASSKVKKSSKQVKEPNLIGQQFNDILIRGKGGVRLKLEDLRDLLQNCTKPEHFNYIEHSMRTYQLKGQDFNTDIATNFVRACIRTKNAKYAAELCSVYKNRIGAWLAPKSIAPLIESLVESGDIAPAVAMISTISKKGVVSSKVSLETLFDAASKSEDSVNHLKALHIATPKLLQKQDSEELLLKYPLISGDKE